MRDAEKNRVANRRLGCPACSIESVRAADQPAGPTAAAAHGAGSDAAAAAARRATDAGSLSRLLGASPRDRAASAANRRSRRACAPVSQHAGVSTWAGRDPPAGACCAPASDNAPLAPKPVFRARLQLGPAIQYWHSSSFAFGGAAGLRIDYATQSVESTMTMPGGDGSITLTGLFASLQLIGVF